MRINSDKVAAWDELVLGGILVFPQKEKKVTPRSGGEEQWGQSEPCSRSGLPCTVFGVVFKYSENMMPQPKEWCNNYKAYILSIVSLDFGSMSKISLL